METRDGPYRLNSLFIDKHRILEMHLTFIRVTQHINSSCLVDKNLS